MANDEEIWKTYPEYPWIEASNLGRVRTRDRVVTRSNGRKQFVKGRVLKQQRDRYGYMRVNIRVNGKCIGLLIHRIVATCFIPNPDNLPEVNHIDCDKTNNRPDNLEWCTPQYNTAYREKYGVPAKEFAKVLRKPVIAVDLKTGKILRFESRSEAARQLGIGAGEVRAVTSGLKKTAGGYWFTEDESEITEEKIQEIKSSMNFRGRVIAINIETSEFFLLESQTEAARQLGFKISSINDVVRGRRDKVGDYWLCYADENAIEKIRVKFGDEISEKVGELMRES